LCLVRVRLGRRIVRAVFGVIDNRTLAERNREIDRSGGFADSAFLVGYSDQPPHNHLRLFYASDSFKANFQRKCFT